MVAPHCEFRLQGLPQLSQYLSGLTVQVLKLAAEVATCLQHLEFGPDSRRALGISPQRPYVLPAVAAKPELVSYPPPTPQFPADPTLSEERLPIRLRKSQCTQFRTNARSCSRRRSLRQHGWIETRRQRSLRSRPSGRSFAGRVIVRWLVQTDHLHQRRLDRL